MKTMMTMMKITMTVLMMTMMMTMMTMIMNSHVNGFVIVTTPTRTKIPQGSSQATTTTTTSSSKLLRLRVRLQQEQKRVGNYFDDNHNDNDDDKTKSTSTTARATSTAATNRRQVLTSTVAASILTGVATMMQVPNNNNFSNTNAWAFDGAGSSAYSGRSPATKAELKRGYIERVAADVKDFNALGEAISREETEGREWINFFITFQRREPDDVGRTYAALVDLRGLPTKKANEYEGGDGLLLANTFTKAGKPPDNTPAVKSFLKLSKSFDAIEVAGRKGDVKKAKVAYDTSASLFVQYLSDVMMPSDLNDPLYK